MITNPPVEGDKGDFQIRDKNDKLLFQGNYFETLIRWKASCFSTQYFIEQYPDKKYEDYCLNITADDLPVRLALIVEREG